MHGQQGDCRVGWNLLGYYEMDRTSYWRLGPRSRFIAILVIQSTNKQASEAIETGMAERR